MEEPQSQIPLEELDNKAVSQEEAPAETLPPADEPVAPKQRKAPRAKQVTEEAEEDELPPAEEAQPADRPSMQTGSPNDNKGPVNMDVIPVGLQPDGQDLAPPHPDLWRKTGHG